MEKRKELENTRFIELTGIETSMVKHPELTYQVDVEGDTADRRRPAVAW